MSEIPPGFVWGAAASAYQIEGAVHDDGRGESIWDRFCATPGRVRGGETGAIACDFYHRYESDIVLMRELGIDAFRFSVAWPRVVPTGRGKVNARGLDFYDRLVDALLEAGIRPFVNLFHLYVTENGAAFADVVTHDGYVHDVERIAYLREHVEAVATAIARGADVRGYFVWSLLDNFEWALGYAKRFGLVYVDYPTLARIPKNSFFWYREVVGQHRRRGAARGVGSPVSRS